MIKNRLNKKGVELSLNTIIIAIIVLIVLVVLVYIFTQRAGIFGTSIEGGTCAEKGGNIRSAGPCPQGTYMIYAKENAADKDRKICCVPVEIKNE